MRYIFSLILITFLFSCSHTKIKKVNEEEMSLHAQKVIGESRELIKKQQVKAALAKLGELEDGSLSSLEKSVKYNLKGVILFILEDFEKALLNFKVAEKYVPENSTLFSQIYLNEASCYYKTNELVKQNEMLGKINFKALNESEQKKYANLMYHYGKTSNNYYDWTYGLVLLQAHETNLNTIQNNPQTTEMIDIFKKLDNGKKLELLDHFQDKKPLVVAVLAKSEVEARYSQGDHSGVEKILDWLNSEYSDSTEVKAWVDDYQSRLSYSSRISMDGIGVIVPLSGEKASFGQKVMVGIESGLKIQSSEKSFEIYPADSEDKPSVGAEKVRELIINKKVPLIIGGLFSETAKAEYLEAKKFGVLYISLSPIYLPRTEKNHLLIEIQGSVESLVSTLLSPEILTRFGRRIGVIFPQGEAGKSYVDEFLRQSPIKGTEITAVASYPKNTVDFRDTAQHFLGLKYLRERKEEDQIWKGVYTNEKSTIRRIQTLPPVLDFDWVFLASFPHETITLIPTLGYYDANRITIFGGPSWASSFLVKEQKKLGTLYFVGEDPKTVNQDFVSEFQKIYQKPPTLMEGLGFEAMKIAKELVKEDYSSRENFDKDLIKKESLKGLNSNFMLTDGLWIKNVKRLKISQGEISQL